jgi:hypothetical protein
VLPAEGQNTGYVKGIAQSVGQHHGFGFLGKRGFKLIAVNVVGWQRHVQENRHCAILDDRRNSCWKTRSTLGEMRRKGAKAEGGRA